MSITKKNIANRTIKIGFAIWLMLSCACAFSKICVNLSSNYTTPITGLSDGNSKSTLTMAFKDENFKDYHIYQSMNVTDFADKIQNMSKGDCSVILGLSSSQECMIAGPILKKNKTIAITTCLIDKVKKFTPYIYSAAPTLEHFSHMTANRIDGTKNTGVIYAFYQPSDIYSSTGYSAFKKYINKPVIGIPVDVNGNFPLDQFQLSIKKSTFIFFTHPLPSSRTLRELDSHNLIDKSTNIIGDASWAFQLSTMHSVSSILNKTNSVVSQSSANLDLIAASSLYKQINKQQHLAPDNNEILSYDIARFATQCYKKVIANGEFNNNDFSRCLETTHYQGITGSMIFTTDSPFAIRNSHFINLKKWLQP